MAYEDDVNTLLEADATLVAILTGGIYKSGELGPLGITRGTTSAAFDANGYLLPCALVKERAQVATADVSDYGAQVNSARQVIEIWLYQEQGSYAALDSARARLRVLLQGYVFSGAFEANLTQQFTRLREPGALAGASMARQDWQLDFIV